MLMKILRAQVYKNRKRGRPRIRWLDDTLEDLRRMDARGHTELAMDRRFWRKLVFGSDGSRWAVVLKKKIYYIL